MHENIYLFMHFGILWFCQFNAISPLVPDLLVTKCNGTADIYSVLGRLILLVYEDLYCILRNQKLYLSL